MPTETKKKNAIGDDNAAISFTGKYWHTQSGSQHTHRPAELTEAPSCRLTPHEHTTNEHAWKKKKKALLYDGEQKITI